MDSGHVVGLGDSTDEPHRSPVGSSNPSILARTRPAKVKAQ